MSERVVIIAAGGTGGHMFPAQSLAELMQKEGWRVILTTDDRGMRYAGGFDENVRVEVLPTASFAQGSIAKRLLAPFQILRGIKKASKIFKEERPDAVVGFGGYPSMPSLASARLKSIPYFIHEQNAVLGRVNKLFQSKARKVACGLWPVKFAKNNAIFVGNPVRENVLEFEASPLPEGKQLQLLVFGGSQGASALSKIVPHAISILPLSIRERLKVVQQARESEIDDVRLAYDRSQVEHEISPFFKDLPARLAKSNFVIARSGASTLAELQIIGRGSILVPLPTAANDHQRANAKALVGAGAALEYEEDENTPEQMALWLGDIFKNPSQLARMADASYRLARPDAAKKLAEIIVEELTI